MRLALSSSVNKMKASGTQRMRESRKKPDPKAEARLAVNLPVATHRLLKRRAAEEGLSMRELVIELLARAGIK